jgi:hypothetical protein
VLPTETQVPDTFQPSCGFELRPCLREGKMIRVIIDAVLFSCMGAFIAGIVAAAMYIS